MGIKVLINRTLRYFGYSIHRVADVPELQPEPVVREEPSTPVPDVYDQDGLRSIHNHDFMDTPDFMAAYERGVQATGGQNYNWHWRIHVGLWAAYSAAKLRGDFVECGVNYGFLSSSIMHYLDWDSMGKKFYLLDTFCGIDERYDEKGVMKTDAGKEFYVNGVDLVTQNFSQWENVKIVEGSVPETLAEVDADEIAYLHIDMNNAPPEVAALNELWEKLVPGAFVLLDDYAYRGYETQKHAMDAVATEKQVKILSLPTGQGLIIKPV